MTREVETARPFDSDLARARMLHLAEGVLVCLRGCTPEEALVDMVSVSRAAGLSTFTVARELLDAAIGAPNSAVVQQHWDQLWHRRSG